MPNAQSILQKKGADVATVDRKTTVLDAAKAMNEQRIGAVVVTDGNRVVGIFTERDILNRIVAAGKDPKTTRIEEVMTSPMACCRRDTRLTECRTVMTQKRIRHLPVVEDGGLAVHRGHIGTLLVQNGLSIGHGRTSLRYEPRPIHGRLSRRLGVKASGRLHRIAISEGSTRSEATRMASRARGRDRPREPRQPGRSRRAGEFARAAPP